jgi:hypothetical protein
MRKKRVLLFFAFAFGSIIIPVAAMLLYGILTYKPPFAITLTGEVTTSSLKKISFESTGVESAQIESASQYSGARQFISINMESGGRVNLVLYPSADRAEQGVSELYTLAPTGSVTVIMGKYFTYQRSDNHAYGVSFSDGLWALVSEAPTKGASRTQLKGISCLQEREAGFINNLFMNNLWAVFVAIGLYVVLLFIIWPRMGSWAARIDRVPGVSPVPAKELYRRLQAINEFDVPFTLKPGKRENELVATWKYADVKWVGIMQAAGMKSTARIRIRLDEGTNQVRAQDTLSSLSWKVGGGGVFSAKVRWSWFRGINFYQYDTGFIGGLIISKDGKPELSTSYSWRFNLTEMKNPIADIITNSGWDWTPVITFSRIING